MISRHLARVVTYISDAVAPASGQDSARELRNNNSGVPRLRARVRRPDLTRNHYEARHHLRHL